MSLETILSAHAETDQPIATFRAIDAALAQEPGHILFTILVHHPALKQSERFYTNKPEAYPVGGRKPVTDSAWMQRVVHGGAPYIGRTREDIAANFFDHELIHSLGCDSILNMPVRYYSAGMMVRLAFSIVNSTALGTESAAAEFQRRVIVSCFGFGRLARSMAQAITTIPSHAASAQ